ncbi:hypothetical protein [Dyella acidisoli]|uniref:Copper resistance protein n=1 Tax=Dyella acidisoli TaxID=1867834 RepID=A0ABQ5XYA7_9GAMM|nr:hypothetical protein [Dyella acidisoli]GLQ95511.1 hypothetical protein GCM10007901_44660 [Dyella acidisoli]
MRIPLRRRHRRILWIGVALFCLLFQQVAMAAYACSLPETQRTMALTGTCADMAANQAHGLTHTQNDPRCAEHCAPHQTAQSDARVPTVPPLTLPFLSPLALGTVAIVPEQIALPDPVQQRPQPPPMLRFCTLLI